MQSEFDRTALLDAIFEQRSRFALIVARDGTLLDANAICFQDIQKADVIGKKFWEIPWGRGLPWKEQFEQAICQEISIRSEGKNKFDRDLEYVIQPLKDHYFLIEVEEIRDRKTIAIDAQQKLSELETIYDTAPIGLCFHDRNLRFVRINERLAEINGITVEDHLGRTLHEVIPVVADALEPIFRHVIESGEPLLNLELKLATQGQPDVLRDWLASYVPVSDATGTVLGVNVIVQEITQVREAEQQLESVLSSINDALIVLDREWRYVYVNDRSAEMNQKPKEFFLGRNFWEVFPETLETEVEEKFQQAMETQTPLSFEHLYIPWNRWFEIRLYPTQDSLSVFYTEITDRKLAESDRDRFFTMSVDMLVIASTNGYFLKTNPAWTEILGWTEKELTSQPYLSFIHPDDIVLTSAEAEKLHQGQSTIEFENRYRHKNGEYRWLNWTVGAFPQEERLYGVAHDITRRKQVEFEREEVLKQEQAAREAAETASRIKDEFLAMLSHELRTPLNPILGWSKILQRDVTDPILAKGLKTIERNAVLQVQLIDDLLDVSRILRGKLAMRQEIVSLPDVIESALDTVILAAQVKLIEIKTTIEPIHGKILGDPARLQQVVWNLLSNAVKFTPDQGCIEIQVRQVGTMVHVQVSDTGKGIAPPFIPYVFESFRQEDSATTRKFGGLGLGLAIARQLVELHGGMIKAESDGEGQGATFTVMLPLIELSR